MTTTIEKLEQADDRLQKSLTHQAALLRALAPDPAEWKYTGEVLDMGSDGHCACGHKIRWGFPLQREKDIKIVGSVCINHFSEINAETFRALCAAQTELSRRLAVAEQQARAAQQQAEAEVAKAEFEAVYNAAHERYSSYPPGSAPRELWAAVASRAWRVPDESPEYRRPADYIRWYRDQAATLRRAVLPANPEQ